MAGFMYVGLAAGFIWTGIASIQCRRWVRPVILSLAWPWLIGGTISVIFFAIYLPGITPPELPGNKPDLFKTIIFVMLAVFGVIFVAIPTILLAFFHSRHVRETCERKDPIVRWTDRAPIPVIALVLWLGVTALSLIVAALSGMGIIPVFGRLVGGITGLVVLIVFAALFLWAARAIYRLDIKGWWVTIILTVVFAVSSFVTYSMVDMAEYYATLGYSAEEVVRMKAFMVSGQAYAWMSVIWLVPAIGYMIYVKRFFPKG